MNNFTDISSDRRLERRQDVVQPHWKHQLRRPAIFATSSSVELESKSSKYDWSNLFYFGGASLVVLHFVALPFIAPGFRKYCLPYVAANEIQLNMLTKSLRKHKIKRVVDLGSGDGVVCIHVAKELGIKAVGYELNPWLVMFSKAWATYSGVGNLCSFQRQDLFKADISKEDGVVLFVVPSMMEPLEVKLNNEMKDNAKVFALRFPLKTWQEEFYESGPPTGGYNVNQLWVYPTQKSQKSNGVHLTNPTTTSPGVK